MQDEPLGQDPLPQTTDILAKILRQQMLNRGMNDAMSRLFTGTTPSEELQATLGRIKNGHAEEALAKISGNVEIKKLLNKRDKAHDSIIDIDRQQDEYIKTHPSESKELEAKREIASKAAAAVDQEFFKLVAAKAENAGVKDKDIQKAIGNYIITEGYMNKRIPFAAAEIAKQEEITKNMQAVNATIQKTDAKNAPLCKECNEALTALQDGNFAAAKNHAAKALEQYSKAHPDAKMNAAEKGTKMQLVTVSAKIQQYTKEPLIDSKAVLPAPFRELQKGKDR